MAAGRHSSPSWKIWPLLFFVVACLAYRIPPTDNGVYGTVIAIDIGNTNSRAAYLNASVADEIQVLTLENGDKFMPSCLAFTDTGDVLVGSAAAFQAASNPSRTICNHLDLIRFSHSNTVFPNDFANPDHSFINSLPYKLSLDGPAEDPVLVRIPLANGSEVFHTPEQILGHLINAIARAAEADLRRLYPDTSVPPVTHVVLSAPPSWSVDQRWMLKESQVGDIGDVFVLRVVNKATAAGIAYRLDLSQDEDVNVLVVDLDGSTAEATVMSVNQGVFEVLGTAEGRITKEGAIWGAVKGSMSEALGMAQLNASDVDVILAVGELSKNPEVCSEHLKVLEEFLEKPPTVSDNVDPAEAAVKGLAVQAAVLASDEGVSDCGLQFDVNGLSLGVESADGFYRTIIPRWTVYPTRKSQNFTTAQHNQNSMLIRVFEGERAYVSDNRFLGELVLGGILPDRKHEPRVEISLEIDANGLVRVIATDLGSGNNATLTLGDVLLPTVNAAREIEDHVREAENHADEFIPVLLADLEWRIADVVDSRNSEVAGGQLGNRTIRAKAKDVLDKLWAIEDAVHENMHILQAEEDAEKPSIAEVDTRRWAWRWAQSSEQSRGPTKWEALDNLREAAYQLARMPAAAHWVSGTREDNKVEKKGHDKL